MSKIRLRVGEYLQARGLTPTQLVEAIGTAANPEVIYKLAEIGNNQEQIDLSVLAAIVQGLRKLMGFSVGIEEILQYIPDLTAEKINPETNPWYERDIYGEIPPYEWGEVDPLEGTKPIRYIPGIGIVIENTEEKVRQSGDANRLKTRFFCVSYFSITRSPFINLSVFICVHLWLKLKTVLHRVENCCT